MEKEKGKSQTLQLSILNILIFQKVSPSLIIKWYLLALVILNLDRF